MRGAKTAFRPADADKLNGMSWFDAPTEISTDDSRVESPPNARRFARFSLRVLLFAVTVLAVWMAAWSRRARIERAARDIVSEAEGWFVCEHQIEDSWKGARDAPVPAPRFLVENMGAEYFTRIVRVHGLYRRLSDAHLETLSRLGRLKSVDSNREWMGSFIGALSLQHGDFSQTPIITDRGLESLSRCRSLESLVLFNTAATDAGIGHLTRLPRLRYLYVASDQITDSSIPHIARMERLEQFWASCTSITRHGANRLRRLAPNCEVIVDSPPHF